MTLNVNVDISHNITCRSGSITKEVQENHERPHNVTSKHRKSVITTGPSTFGCWDICLLRVRAVAHAISKLRKKQDKVEGKERGNVVRDWHINIRYSDKILLK
jgi:hypothetical protein